MLLAGIRLDRFNNHHRSITFAFSRYLSSRACLTPSRPSTLQTRALNKSLLLRDSSPLHISSATLNNRLSPYHRQSSPFSTTSSTIINNTISTRSFIHPAATTTSTTEPCVDMEVTKDNFVATLPLVTKALEDAAFLSLDCEMTGLFVNNEGRNGLAYLADIEERYQEVCSSCFYTIFLLLFNAPGNNKQLLNTFCILLFLQMVKSSSNFVINQFGLSAFIPNPSTNSYVARTFNFYVFPRTLDDWDQRFLCQAGSLEFLASCHFDFNKWIHQGIGYLPLSVRDAKLAAVDKQQNRSDILVNKEEDIQLIANMTADIKQWLQSENQSVLELDAVNSFQRALQYQTLRKAEELFNHPDPPGFYIERIENESGRAALRLVKATSSQVAEWEEQQRAQKLDAIHAAAGFSKVFELLRASGKPVVGHNLSFDLAYSMHSFIKPLPETWQEYKELLGIWFPGGIYDTKYIARQLDPEVFPDNSLGPLYDTLKAMSTDGTTTTSGSTNNAVLPLIEHGVGFERYKQVGDVSEYAHEAGFDAYMTGAAFGQLAAYIASTTSNRNNLASHLETVESLYKWRMNLSRSDLPYAALQGPDPVPDRSRVLFVSNLSPGAFRYGSDIVKLFPTTTTAAQGTEEFEQQEEEETVGSVRATVVESGAAAVVEFADATKAELGARILRVEIPGCFVEPYERYSELKANRREQAQQSSKVKPWGLPVKRPRVAEDAAAAVVEGITDDKEEEAARNDSRCSIM